MFNRFAILVLVMTAVGCSGGSTLGNVSPAASAAPNPSAPTTSIVKTTLSLAGATPVRGAAGIFPLVLTAIDAKGALIVGNFTNPVSITSNDTADISFSTSLSSTLLSSITVANGATPIYVTYGGGNIPRTATVSASSVGAVTSTLAFGTIVPAATNGSFTFAQNGAPAAQGPGGSFVLTAAEYDATGALVTGTYPTPITITTNDSVDLLLSTSAASGAPGSSVTVANSATVVVVAYDGKSVPAGTQFTATAGALGAKTIAFAPAMQPAHSSQIASLIVTQAGAAPREGTPGQFILTVTALDATGTTVSGVYATGVTLTTNDSTDLALSTTQGVAGGASVTIPSSQTVIFATYSGGNVPVGTQFTATLGSALAANLPFTPAVTSLQTVIASLVMSRNSLLPIIGSPGIFPVYVTALDANGDTLQGTLPSDVTVTLNNICDLGLGLATASASVISCTTPPGPNPPNPGVQHINNSNQAIYVLYDGIAAVPVGTGLSATTVPNASNNPGVPVCAAISFPGNVIGRCYPTTASQGRQTQTYRLRGARR